VRRLFVVVATVVLAAWVLGACGGGDSSTMGHGAMGGATHMAGDGHMSAMDTPPEGAIRVGLRNWAVEPAVSSVKAGKVTFWAVHEMEHAHGMGEGGNVHDLQVLRKAADGTWDLVGQVRNLAMGEAAALEVELVPGEYELAYTVVEEVGKQVISHYEREGDAHVVHGDCVVGVRAAW